VVESVLTPADTAAHQLLDKVLSGGRLDPAEAKLVYEEAELLTLGRVADIMRQRRHPEGIVSFIVDRNINYSNICISQCKFCAFWRDENAPDSYLLSFAEIGEKIRETLELGGTRILMQGGLHPSLGIEYYEEMLRFIKSNYPIEVDAFSPAETDHIARLSGLDVPRVLQRLKAAGLDGLPGGGAEILEDRVREQVSPRKIGWKRWMSVMREAQRQGLATSATMVFGMNETVEDRVMHLIRLREAQDEALSESGASSGFIAFIPWSFQPANTVLGGETATGVEYLRMVATARLVLDNFDNIQASWVTQGSKLAQVALRFGANDYGDVMIEENVVRAAGVTFRISKEEMVKIIKDAGFRPAQRDTRYRRLSFF
jgi:cyclic dehypoxanthinyl futalosine synthase